MAPWGLGYSPLTSVAWEKSARYTLTCRGGGGRQAGGGRGDACNVGGGRGAAIAGQHATIHACLPGHIPVYPRAKPGQQPHTRGHSAAQPRPPPPPHLVLCALAHQQQRVVLGQGCPFDQL